MHEKNGTTERRSTLTDEQLLYVNGEYVRPEDDAKFEVLNPATGGKIYDCSSAGVREYELAIKAADAAFTSWSQTAPSARRLIFLRAADTLERYLHDDAPEILSAEVSAVSSWIRVNIMATANILRETAGQATQMRGEIVPADRPGTMIMIMREAIGVVFAISPWNAPVNLTARAIASPLICGNTVVLKPSEFSPKSQHLVVRAFQEAGLPSGCLNFLPTKASDAAKVTEYATKHSKVRRLNYTGSDRVGKIIAGWAASCLKQCVLELGGKAPVIVLEDANIEDAVEAVVFGGFCNSGQICMSTERVIVEKAIEQKFTATLLEKVKTINWGDQEGVSMAGLYTPQSAERFLAMIEQAIADGAELLAGDRSASGPNRTLVQPHVLGKVTRTMDVFREESFGPVLCLTVVDSQAEAIEVANDSEFSLSAAVFSQDIMKALWLAKQVRAGSCHINGPTVYIEATLPNGGTGGRSGYGRLGGSAGIEEYTERKIISLAQSGLKCVF
ncbi:uncharacterized protein HMPREF1541_09656 [Cyphellophora europaea CBS 101466]|uniref:Aldehyde dehydrogenase domain-containing protein n=1 Tax=Cyphellophora europaea (strain CBS 101466) TaxID=1220924 RepID=W2S7U9_CYPE1|nr:uncharacterized protein HMPREF1541_09656 [Cyphellophora europaea CBS 101466]ETN44781.1 hypothetical protein HMPREF1541_09656 [Cyphellophora europaea CBS 101466]